MSAFVLLHFCVKVLPVYSPVYTSCVSPQLSTSYYNKSHLKFENVEDNNTDDHVTN